MNGLKQHAGTAAVVLITLLIFTYVVAPQIDKLTAGTAPAPTA